MSLKTILVATVLASGALLLVSLFLNSGPISALFGTGRPQDPKKRDYIVEQISFSGGDQHTKLSGELTMPKGEGPFAAAILITGSGPQNRNEEVAGHRPFLVLSDHLTNKGFAVLRYDDRGVGSSTGDFSSSTTLDFAKDAAAAHRWLQLHPKIDSKAIGFIGHSEGGIIATKATKLAEPAYIVLLASPVEPIAQTLIRQAAEIPRSQGKKEDWILKNVAATTEIIHKLKELNDPGEFYDEWRSRFKYYKSELTLPSNTIEELLEGTPPAWFKWLIEYNQLQDLSEFLKPVLSLYGSKDIQVSPSPNLPLLHKALRHHQSTTIVLSGLNHLFQPAATGAVEEYHTIETTFDTNAMDVIADWIKSVISNED